MEVRADLYDLVETVCRDLYLKSLKEIPPDIVDAIKRAAATETREVAKRIFSHYLESIELGRQKNMMVCQDTGIPIYRVNIGGNLRLDGAQLVDAIVRGTERATREHPLRSSIVSPLRRENRQTNSGERIPILHFDFVRDSDVLESAWTHITCNPVAVNMQCWRAERRRAKIWPDGRVEEGF